MTSRTDTHIRIREVLGDRSLTAMEIAKEVGIKKYAAQVVLLAMVKRRELLAIRRRTNGINHAARYRIGDTA